MFKKIDSISIKKCKTINDVKGKPTFSKHSKRLTRDIPILIIDDQGFDLESLHNIGYTNVHKKYKHVDIKDYKYYDIIFCDINNVAEDFSPDYQGAALAREIKNHYPEKFVVIYSAQPQSLSIKKYIDNVDDYIEKVTSAAELSEKLELYIENLNDPISVWERSKKRLDQNEVSPKHIALLEHYYVRSLEEKYDYTSNLKQYAKNSDTDILFRVAAGLTKFISYYMSKD